MGCSKQLEDWINMREYSPTVVMEETNNSVLTTLQKRLIVFFVFFIMFLLLIVRILNESGKKNKVNFTFHFKRLQKIRIIVMQIFYFVRR